MHDATSVSDNLPVPTDEQHLHNEQCNVPNPTYADPIDVIKRSTDIHITSNSGTQSPYMDPVDVHKGVGTLRQFGKSTELIHTNKISDITHSQGPVYSEPFNATAPAVDDKTKVRPFAIVTPYGEKISWVNQFRDFATKISLRN